MAAMLITIINCIFGCFLLFLASASEICPEKVIDGTYSRAFGCPRLSDTKDDEYCCGNINDTLYCCKNETASVHYQEKLAQAKIHQNNNLGLVLVSAYGAIVFMLFLVDWISHFKVYKKRKNEQLQD
ncbi:protein shisa-like-1a [Clavelina lepadiformis]|uniref:Shisa N-terminal domain-containing protein n=1 Tax=Clavelina lepadiformis TaxID=159417 RepID=A0ABP0GYC8_CLALP